MSLRRLLPLLWILACGLCVLPDASRAVEIPPLKVTWQTLPDHACFGGCPQWLALEGKIAPESVATVRDALARRPAIRLVLVHSAGGHVESAMAIARLLRARGVAILVARTIEEDCFRSPASCVEGEPARAVPARGYCASACVQLLAGGAERAVLGDGYVGVHRYVVVSRTMVRRTYRVTVQTDADGRQRKTRHLESETRTTEPVNEEEFDPAVYATARTFFRSMGVSPELVDSLEKTPNADMRRLDPSDMNRWSLTTGATPASLLAASRGVPGEERIVFSLRIRRALETVVLRRPPGERTWRAEAWVTEPGSLVQPEPRQLILQVPEGEGRRPPSDLSLANGAYAGPPWAVRVGQDEVCTLLAAPSLVVTLRDEPAHGQGTSQKALVSQTDITASPSAVRGCGRSRPGPV